MGFSPCSYLEHILFIRSSRLAVSESGEKRQSLYPLQHRRVKSKGAPGLAFETWDPSNRFLLETPPSSLSLGAKPTCPGMPWRDLQFHSTPNEGPGWTFPTSPISCEAAEPD